MHVHVYAYTHTYVYYYYQYYLLLFLQLLLLTLLLYTDMVAYANGCVRHFMRHVLHDRHGDLRREPPNQGCTVGPLGSDLID